MEKIKMLFYEGASVIFEICLLLQYISYITDKASFEETVTKMGFSVSFAVISLLNSIKEQQIIREE